MNKRDRFINRELSWLAFNERVLEEARDAAAPLLERLKFLAITASNLDEFFMVRVGGLQQLVESGATARDFSGRTPRRQLRDIACAVRELIGRQYRTLHRDLLPALARHGIRLRRPDELDAAAAAYLARVFEQELYPILTPLYLAPREEMPALAGLTLHLAVRARGPGEPAGAERLIVVPLPRAAPRFIALPEREGYELVTLEEVVAMHLDRLLPGLEAQERGVFRLTRNADLSVSEDLAADLLSQMRRVLVERRESDGVRLETDADMPRPLRDELARRLQVAPDDIYEMPAPLDLSAWMSVAQTAGYEELKAEQWPPQPAPATDTTRTMFEQLDRQDLLLFTPYESFDPVVRLVEQAAADPDVLAIKQILYRTSPRSPIVAALARAAAAGKQVTALVELKARFDEARNIEWALALERAGVQVIYGIRGLKTHAKVCLIVRRETGGLRRYVHFGTGNYNEITARMYSDISYLTAAEDYGADASQFFNTITARTAPRRYRRLEAAPLGLRPRLLELIESETQRAQQGGRAQILAKVNSLADPALIEALYRASQAGVKIELSVRGICCLRPGVKGLSENIRVVSVVDRFLEHARIFYFHQGGTPQVFISSADWMPRNLDKRVELLVPIADPAAAARLAQIVKTCLRDNVKGRELGPDGVYRRARPASGARPLRSQEVFYRAAVQAARRQAGRRPVFAPHRPRAAARRAAE